MSAGKVGKGGCWERAEVLYPVQSRRGLEHAILRLAFRRLILLAVVFLPWGGLLPSAGGIRISAILAGSALLIGVCDGAVIRGALRHRAAAGAFLVFVVLSMGAGATAASGWTAAAMTARIGAYGLIGMSVSGFRWSVHEIRRVMTAYVVSATMMSVVTILDYSGVISSGAINSGSRLVTYGLSASALDMSGPFASRSILATHLALALPIAVCFATDSLQGYWKRGVWMLAAVVLGLASLLTLSRGLAVAVGSFACFWLWLSVGRRSLGSCGVLTMVVILMAVAAIVHTMMPNVAGVFWRRALSLEPSTVSRTQEDMVRVYALRATVEDLGRAPWGLGFTDVIGRTGRLNVHSSYTALLRAAGPIGAMCLLVAVMPVVLRVRLARRWPVAAAIYSSLLTYMMFGVGHNVLGSLFAWILVGCAYAIMR